MISVAAAARLSDEERKRDRAAFFGSIHRTMNHILVADRIWLGRLAGRVPEPGFIGVDGIKSLDHELAADFRLVRRGATRDIPNGVALAGRARPGGDGPVRDAGRGAAGLASARAWPATSRSA